MDCFLVERLGDAGLRALPITLDPLPDRHLHGAQKREQSCHEIGDQLALITARV
jgi:hypothetical protein